MRIRVLFFATFRDLTGTRETIVEFPEELVVKDLKSHLLIKFPGLSTTLNSGLIAIDREFAFDGDTIPDGAEVAMFPPVSGGNHIENPTICSIVEDEIEMNAVLSSITERSTGAVSIFAGLVRGVTTRTNPHETKYLEYEAYKPMAEAKMKQIADEIRARWSSIVGIAIVQRVGRLEVGEQTVVIACSANHRDTGVFEAARYGIDRLKEIVPVWKKEINPVGEIWVEGDYIPDKND
jgi:molybdopterin synthase catalytic subunit/molybdopterin converting factor small subunit